MEGARRPGGGPAAAAGGAIELDAAGEVPQVPMDELDEIFADVPDWLRAPEATQVPMDELDEIFEDVPDWLRAPEGRWDRVPDSVVIMERRRSAGRATGAPRTRGSRSRSRSPGHRRRLVLEGEAAAAPGARRARRAMFQVVLLLDVSGSMQLDAAGGRSRLELALDAVEAFAEAAATFPDVNCSLTTFNEVCSCVLRDVPAAGRRFLDRVRQLRGTIRPAGAGYYTRALEGLRGHRGDGDVIIAILLSDGTPAEDLIRRRVEDVYRCFDELRRELTSLKLFTVGFGRFNASCLRRLAADGGGTFLPVEDLSPAVIKGAFRDLVSQVSVVRQTTMTAGVEALNVKDKPMEPADAWRLPDDRRLRLAEDHWAWIMLAAGEHRAARAADAAGLSSDVTELVPCGKATKVSLHKMPFAKGGLRYAYHLFFQADKKGTTHLVVKESKHQLKYSTPQEEHRFFLKNHRRAEVLSKEFNDRCKKAAAGNPGSILGRASAKFVKAFVLKISDESTDSGFRYVIAESFIDGAYSKFSSNNGWLNGSLREAETTEIAGAFSHFTFDKTGGEELCVDIQGVGLTWTDPQLHSRGKGYGFGDFGEAGIKMFFESHKCGMLCALLGLRRVCASTLALGALAQRPQDSSDEPSDEARTCVICLEAPRDYVCLPCGHLCFCELCLGERQWTECPVCRQPVARYSRVELQDLASPPPSTFVPELAELAKLAAAPRGRAAADMPPPSFLPARRR